VENLTVLENFDFVENLAKLNCAELRNLENLGVNKLVTSGARFFFLLFSELTVKNFTELDCVQIHFLYKTESERLFANSRFALLRILW
jgi:hypothetical protein